jgi:hypothetical protein
MNRSLTQYFPPGAPVKNFDCLIRVAARLEARHGDALATSRRKH